MFTFGERQARIVDEIVARLVGMPGPLLPILHEVQDAFGFIPAEAVSRIAGGLNLSRAEVHGVISFYHWFRQHEPGRRMVRICRAEACQALDCEATEAHARSCLGTDYHGTSNDGAFTLEPVYCLGNCAAGPSVMIDETLYGRVTPQRLEQLLDEWRQRA